MVEIKVSHEKTQNMRYLQVNLKIESLVFKCCSNSSYGISFPLASVQENVHNGHYNAIGTIDGEDIA